MIEGEMLKISVEEFSRLQGYMFLVDKDSEAYKSMKVHYTELKVMIIRSSGKFKEEAVLLILQTAVRLS